MTIEAWLILTVVIVLPLLFVAVTYNNLVTILNRIRESWSDVDTELKRRYDLIPNLVAAVKGYAQHERTVLERVVELRGRCMAAAGSRAQQGTQEGELTEALKRLMVVVENYPVLKADQHFLQLQRELVNTEDRIQAARRFYNGNVRDYRNACETLPSNLVARGFGFQPEEYFGATAAEREAPAVGTL